MGVGIEQIAEFIASAAVIVAATIVAANLGARITGWGFVIYLVASLCWLTLGLLTGQTGLVVANAFLLVVNVFGVWRWLGRQASHEQARKAATERSAERRVPTLFSANALAGMEIRAADGVALATVVDAMLGCDRREIVYVVASQGGVAGVGEVLRAVDPRRLEFSEVGVSWRGDPDEFQSLPVLQPDSWPSTLPLHGSPASPASAR